MEYISVIQINRPLPQTVLTPLTCRHYRRSVSPQNSSLHATIAQFVQRGCHFDVMGRTSQIQVKAVLPGTALDRSTLDLEQVNSPSREGIERVVQSARL